VALKYKAVEPPRKTTTYRRTKKCLNIQMDRDESHEIGVAKVLPSIESRGEVIVLLKVLIKLDRNKERSNSSTAWQS
jgi:hypothetical protein